MKKFKFLLIFFGIFAFSINSFGEISSVKFSFEDYVKNSKEDWIDIQSNLENELIVDVYAVEEDAPVFIETRSINNLHFLFPEFSMELETGKNYYLLFKVINCFDGKLKYVSSLKLNSTSKDSDVKLTFYSLRTSVRISFDERLPIDWETLRVSVERQYLNLTEKLFHFYYSKFNLVNNEKRLNHRDEISLTVLGANSTVKEVNPENFEIRKDGVFTEKITISYYSNKPGVNYQIKKLTFDVPVFYDVKVVFVPNGDDLIKVRERNQKPFLKVVPVILVYD